MLLVPCCKNHSGWSSFWLPCARNLASPGMSRADTKPVHPRIVIAK
jgi:hypothetical protein